MKVVRLIVGIFSIVLFMVIAFQSCATGLGNALTENTTDTSGSAGIMLAVFVLTAGIAGICTRNNKVGSIITGAIYLIAAIIGLANLGTFGDLIVWSVLSIIFGLLFIVSGIFIPKKQDKKQTVK
jgi:hypothetical protein